MLSDKTGTLTENVMGCVALAATSRAALCYACQRLHTHPYVRRAPSPSPAPLACDASWSSSSSSSLHGTCDVVSQAIRLRSHGLALTFAQVCVGVHQWQAVRQRAEQRAAGAGHARRRPARQRRRRQGAPGPLGADSPPRLCLTPICTPAEARARRRQEPGSRSRSDPQAGRPAPPLSQLHAR